MKIDTRKTALFGALCFFFSALEVLFPKPIPFLRLGLANLPLLIGLKVLSTREYAVLVCIKIVGAAVISGTMFSYIFIFSIVSSISSALIMYLLHSLLINNTQRNAISLTGISLVGSLCSNGTQLLLARYFLFGDSARLMIPTLLIAGTITALILGWFAEVFVHTSKWFLSIKEGKIASGYVVWNSLEKNIKEERSAKTYFFTGLVLLPFLAFSPNLSWSIVCFLLVLILNILSKRKIALFPLILMSFAIVVFNVLSPAGRVIFSVGEFRITEYALVSGLKKALTLGGMVLLSRWMIRPSLRLPGSFGELVSQSFIMLERLLEEKHQFKRENIVASLDIILEKITNKDKA